MPAISIAALKWQKLNILFRRTVLVKLGFISPNHGYIWWDVFIAMCKHNPFCTWGVRFLKKCNFIMEGL
jgi:hypothetical protein